MYLNDLFRKQETKYDLRDKTLLEQPIFFTKSYGHSDVMDQNYEMPSLSK